MSDNWFHRLTGFEEGRHSTVQQLLEVDGRTLRSKVNSRSFRIGEFEMASLAELRAQVAQGAGSPGSQKVSIVT